MKRYILLIFAFSHAICFAQSLSITGPNSYSIASATHIGAYGVPSLERRPTGMIYGDSGNKLYVVGSIADIVVQYDLSTAYDFSSRSAIKSYFRVKTEDSNPEDVIFNDDGTKMYILGGSGDDITEYVLSTPWDLFSIDTATNVPVVFNAEAAIDTYLSPTTNHGDNLTGFRFNNNGTKLFILDRSADRVFEFSLDTAYDISTSGAVDTDISINVLENDGRAMEFNNDGTKLYVIGYTGDNIITYGFSTGYDLTSLTSSSSSVALTEGEPNSILINNDGTKFYIAGFIDQEIKEYSLAIAYDFSSTITLDATYAAPTIERIPHGMVFNNDGTKLFTVGSSLDIVSEITLSKPYDISTGNLKNGLHINADEANPLGLAFNSSGTVLYVIGNDDDGINQYALSSAFDLSSTITKSGPFTVDITETNNERSPRDLVFNADGSRLFVLGNRRDRVFQFNLTANYDLSNLASDYAGSYNINSVETSSQGIAFNNDGSKFFIAGNTGDDINEFTLENNFDVTSGIITNSDTFSISSEELTILDIVFNGDGSKFYITGSDSDNMNQYYTHGKYDEVATTNNGTLDNLSPLVFTLAGDTFADVDADDVLDLTTEFTIANLPIGITPVFTLTSGDTVATLTFTGVADSHLDTDDVANLVFTFTDAAFTSSTAASLGAENLSLMEIDFIDCPSDIVYDGVSWTGGSGPSGAPDNTDTSLGVRVQGDIILTADVDCFCVHVETGNTLSFDDANLNISGSLEMIGDIRLLGISQLKQTHTGVKNTSGLGNLYKDVKGTLTNVFQTGFWSSPVTTNGATYNVAGVLKDGTIPLATTGEPSDITFTTDVDGDTTTPITLSLRWLAKFINSDSWVDQINETTELFNPGEGFSKKSTGALSGQNYTFKGRPNDGDYEHTIDAFGSGTWSLLGNPYPSTLDIDQFISDNTAAGSIENTVYFYEAGNDTSHTSATYTGGYAERVKGLGVGVGNSASSLGRGTGTKVPGQYIGIGQGFFVEASSGGGTITFSNSQRVFTAPGPFFSKGKTKKEAASLKILRLGFEFLIDEEIYHRPVTIAFRGLSNNFEKGYEAEMWDFRPTDMALKIENRSEPFSIVGTADIDFNLKVPLKIQCDQEREITFTIDESININKDVFLYDSFSNKYYNLSNENLKITLLAGEYYNRFFITFSDNRLNTNSNLINDISIFKENNLLIVSSEKEMLDAILVYNILGKKIASFINTNKLSKIKINTSNYKKGIYIVRANNSKGSITKKIIIN